MRTRTDGYGEHGRADIVEGGGVENVISVQDVSVVEHGDEHGEGVNGRHRVQRRGRPKGGQPGRAPEAFTTEADNVSCLARDTLVVVDQWRALTL